MTLQDRQGPIDASIAHHLVEATPEWWSSATLTVIQFTNDAGFEEMIHTITNQDGHREFVIATEEIYSATFQLLQLFREYGRPWRKVIYTINQLANGDWNYKAKFEY